MLAFVRTDGFTDDLPGVLAKTRRLQTGTRGRGVGVRVQREHRLADEVLDERESASRGRVVGIGDAPVPEGAVDGLFLSDHRVAHQLEQSLAGRRPALL